MRRLISFVCLSFLLQCGETTPPDVCAPEEGEFIKGVRYVAAKFIREDGTWDYKAWSEYMAKKSRFVPSPECIPLERPPSLQERLEELEEEIDLKR